MAAEPRDNDVTVAEAIRRQVSDPDNHELGLIEECLRLTPDERLQRLTIWVAFVASARRSERSAAGAGD
jgi:hypothetical protein